MSGRLSYMVLAVWLLSACDERALEPPSEQRPPAGFSAEAASRVAAVVDGRAITVGDLVRRIEGMPRLTRKDYRVSSRRRALLDAAIDDELLAAEAVRRGLHLRADVADAIAQELVDAMMRDVRASVPEAEALPTERLRAYYQEHERRWVIPERRRVSLLTYASADAARAAFQRLGANPSDEAWRDAAKRGGCDDEACDRGHVGPMDDADGGNDRVPDRARAHVFTIEQLGGAALVVNATEAWVVRYTGRTAAQAKSFEQAEQSVRNMLHQQLLEAERDALIARLREQLGFAIHADGVDLLELPAGFDDYVPYWQKKAP